VLTAVRMKAYGCSLSSSLAPAETVPPLVRSAPGATGETAAPRGGTRFRGRPRATREGADCTPRAAPHPPRLAAVDAVDVRATAGITFSPLFLNGVRSIWSSRSANGTSPGAAPDRGWPRSETVRSCRIQYARPATPRRVCGSRRSFRAPSAGLRRSDTACSSWCPVAARRCSASPMISRAASSSRNYHNAIATFASCGRPRPS
jgi:hypothetical protein